MGLQDRAGEIDMRKLTLAFVTRMRTCAFTTGDLRAMVAALHLGQFDNLAWAGERPLGAGVQAFLDLASGAGTAPKVVRRP